MNNPLLDFAGYFRQLTGHEHPRSWQGTLGIQKTCQNRTLRIPTGLGKTEGVLAAWLYHRVKMKLDTWPRRLAWCLPMRTLVGQTAEVAEALVRKLDLPHSPQVYTLMGGEDAGEWFLRPEQPAILIGTQDMLLSRALNRGYGSGRARWPAEYGLLHHDTLWIMDEVQLMDVGLATSAQLQAYRDQDRSKALRPCYTWWMSATLQPDWLNTVDTQLHYPVWVCDPIVIPRKEQSGGLWSIEKKLDATDEIGPDRHDDFAKRILDEHGKTPLNANPRVTLVICNTVERACRTYDALRKNGPTQELKLIHSRFRPHERKTWREKFLNRAACEDQPTDRILVATQVVEAGVDISASCLITECAPWPSLVQRFGRCARYGGAGRVLVVKRGADEKAARPYTTEELDSAWDALAGMADVGVGIAALEQYEASLDTQAKQRLYPYNPAHLLLRREFDELFDTTPDLTGADLDISRFIRSDERERDLQVFWRELAADTPPDGKVQPQRDELCAVPFLDTREWLCEKQAQKLKKNMRAWVWDWIDGKWDAVKRDALTPGRIVCVAADCGGYTAERGFTPASSATVTPVPIVSPDDHVVHAIRADARDGSDEQSLSRWKTIACHGQEVMEAVTDIASKVDLSEKLLGLIQLAARWHDVGKAHPAFQGCIKGDFNHGPGRGDLAKAPDSAWVDRKDRYPCPDQAGSHRLGFRHELASALALFAVLERYQPDHPALLGPWAQAFEAMRTPLAVTPIDDAARPTPLEQAVLDLDADDFGLLVYLVAAHHGKVRVALHAGPKDQDYVDRDNRGLPIRGVREGDVIPSIRLDADQPAMPPFTLTLEPAKLGLSPRTGASYRERTGGLRERFGPATLAYLEALLRAADVRASRLNTPDPALETEAVK